MKSLDSVYAGLFYPDIYGEFDVEEGRINAIKLTKDLENYIDRYYVKRPLFDDREPVQLGDTFSVYGIVDDIVSGFKITADTCSVIGEDGYDMSLEKGEFLSHSSKQYTNTSQSVVKDDRQPMNESESVAVNTWGL